jgi:ribonuclease E
MREVTAGRTLVKSPPELWAVCSDAESLGQHLEAFGEIRITRLEPETTVAWEGERASGTVRIEPAGWGTKVTVTAAPTQAVAAPEQVVTEPVTEAPVPVLEAPADTPAVHDLAWSAAALEQATTDPEPTHRPRFLARLFGGSHAPAPKPVLSEPVASEPAPLSAPAATPPASLPLVAAPAVELQPQLAAEPQPPVDAAAVLEAALDRLGQAHRRPFSR